MSDLPLSGDRAPWIGRHGERLDRGRPPSRPARGAEIPLAEVAGGNSGVRSQDHPAQVGRTLRITVSEVYSRRQSHRFPAHAQPRDEYLEGAAFWERSFGFDEISDSDMFGFSWSRDGKKLAFSRGQQKTDVILMSNFP